MARWSEGQAPPSQWNVGMSVNESRQFDRVTNGEPADGSVVDNVSVNFGYSASRERSSLSFSANAGTSIRRGGEEGRNNRINAGLGFGWSQRVTEHFQSTLSVNASRNFSRERLTELGIVAPNLESYSAGVSWSTGYQASASTGMSTSLSYRFTDIVNSEAIPGSQIVLDRQPFGNGLTIPTEVGGNVLVRDAQEDVLDILATEGLDGRGNRSQFVSAGFGLGHTLSQRTTIGFNVSTGYRILERGISAGGTSAAGQFYVQRAVGKTSSLNAVYAVTRSLAIVPTTTIQTLSGGYSTSGTEKSISLTLSGGVSHYFAEGAPSQLTPIANLSLAGALTRSTTTSIFYGRQFSAATGFGRTLLSDVAGANLSQQLGARASLGFSVGAAFSTDPLNPFYASNARRASLSFSLRIVGGLSAGTNFSMTDTEYSDLGRETTTRQKIWSFNLSWGTTWH